MSLSLYLSFPLTHSSHSLSSYPHPLTLTHTHAHNHSLSLSLHFLCLCPTRSYASLFFVFAISETDNELITLEIIHRYVELLDKYFGSVCELDIIFNFEKVRTHSFLA